MRAHTGWSYKPYKPPLFDSGDIYICRIAPSVNSISFDWMDMGAREYQVYCRIKDEGAFALAGRTKGCTYTIGDLKKYCDYEFYVAAGEKKSRIRMARCGDCVGTVVNYLHPGDNAYSFSGKYLCSPSLLHHSDGYLLASMDLYAAGYPQNLTLLYRSDDDGKTWRYVSELFPCFWGKLFLHRGELYMLGCSTEYGDLLIGKSTDGGETFTDPVVLFRGSNGKDGCPGVHKNPQPVVECDGRIWNTMEWGSWESGGHAAMVMSVPIGSDLLNPENWLFSEPVKYDPAWEGTAVGPSTGNIEGCLIRMDGVLYNVMRYDMTKTIPNYGKAIAYKVDTQKPENPLTYAGCMDFPANHAKFEIQYDPNTQRYYSIASRITDSKNASARNLLSLLVSEDGWTWRVLRDIYDKTDCSKMKVGFQYVDFLIEDGDLLLLCRTAMNHAHNFHDSNYSTFDRIYLRESQQGREVKADGE